jgi:hypothetical protein
MAYRLRYDRHFMQLLEVLPGDVRALARKQIKSLIGPKSQDLYDQLGLGKKD